MSYESASFLASRNLKVYSDIPEALNNLEQLVSDITYQFDTDLKLPRFNRDMPAVDQLRQLAQSGLESKKLTSAVIRNV